MPLGGRIRALSGPELERKIVLTNLLAGASTAFWLVPITFIFNPVPQDVFVFLTVLAAAVSMATVLIGVVYRSQRNNMARAVERDIVERAALAEIHQLVHDLRVFTQDHHAEVTARVERVAARVERTYWNAYSDAAADMQGGEQVVNETTTRRLPRCAEVVPLPPPRLNGNSR
jgi:hypothetical protein